MAANLTITVCRPVRVLEQITGPAGEVMAIGVAVKINTTTGLLEKANGSSAAEARLCGILITPCRVVNETVTAVRKGIVDIGAALDALTYDDDVFLSDTDGLLADTVGSNALPHGNMTVIPGNATTTPDKLLRVDL
uniref:Uncharacterized protein n=1 Tax=viral metagenome TaxID=1070528 RepID=A0A6M3L5N8_9ZZZZ